MTQFHFASIEIWDYKQYESVCCWLKTQSLVTIKIKKEWEKNEKEKKKEQLSIARLNEKGAKTLQSVAVFNLCKAEWITETAPKWTSEN